MSSPARYPDRAPVAPPTFQDMELREEWQDDGFPRPLPEDFGGAAEVERSPDDHRPPAPPTSLALSGTVGGGAKKRLAAPSLNLTLNRRDSQDVETMSLDINLEALETPSGSETGTLPDGETGTLPDGLHELEWEDDLPRVRGGTDRSEGLMELDQVDSRGRRWRTFCMWGHEYQVNMSVVEPYLQVLSHGGYYGDEMNAIILFTSCYLPEKTVENYEYIMDNLFMYVVGTLDLMVSENYLLIYLCALAPRNKVPPIKWLHRCYLSIDRRLKKDLKGLLVVHPAWYIRAVVTVMKPFISEKFSRKIRFIRNLQDLSRLVPTERLQIPDAVRHFDECLNG
ncbi:BCL2/adenovirus E1B 19 kDa protein-interacting protein 2-like [Brachionichthys hirsutus]|uniref:BCL2/adenovirus E1B 19 kDa protein-interacting protein 2-like n=1 Tax=Brachionichthys hirsutus TaxID=412623 RepID=UPI003605049D